MKLLFRKTFVACLLSFMAVGSKAATYYVATNGADVNPGSIARPFRTIQRAADIAGAGDTICIRAGIFRETVSPRQSGQAGQPITFCAFAGESVSISGAEPVLPKAWKKFAQAIYWARAACTLKDGNQIFVDGQMLNEARFPNTSLDVTRPTKWRAEGANSVGVGIQAVGTITNADLNQPPGYWVGATLNIVLGKVWCAETVRVSASGPGWLNFPYKAGEDYQPQKGNPFFLTGKVAGLNAPGEWFFDDSQKKLFVWTPTEDSPARHTVEAKQRLYAFDLRGKSHIVVRGLKLFAATIVTDRRSSNNLLEGLNARYVSHFSELVRWRTGLADSGIILDGQSNTLQNSMISFSAGNGVALLGNGNIVSNNVIKDVDYSGGVGAGVNTGGGCRGAVIVRNTIFNVGHRMIDIGHLKAGFVAYNDLSHGGLQVTDFGGIYTASTDGENTRICHNLIHDTDAPSSGLERPNNSKGIYIDNGSSNYVIDHNVTWNVEKALVLNAREGTREVNRNNLILNNTLSGTAWSYGWKHCPSPGTLIANNIFLAKAEPGVESKATNNLFANTDPRFIAGSRFQLAADSPARKAGFVCKPYTGAVPGGTPDLGAFAFGVPPWTAGSTLAKEKEPPTAQVTRTTQAATSEKWKLLGNSE